MARGQQAWSRLHLKLGALGRGSSVSLWALSEGRLARCSTTFPGPRQKLDLSYTQKIVLGSRRSVFLQAMVFHHAFWRIAKALSTVRTVHGGWTLTGRPICIESLTCRLANRFAKCKALLAVLFSDRGFGVHRHQQFQCALIFEVADGVPSSGPGGCHSRHFTVGDFGSAAQLRSAIPMRKDVACRV